MSKTVPVEYNDVFFWAYDVAFQILCVEAARVGAETPADARPGWWADLERNLLDHAAVGANWAFLLDDYTDEQRRLLLDSFTEAARRVEARGGVSLAEVETWDEVEGDAASWLRHAEHIDAAPLVELAAALVDLEAGTLPPDPPGGHWFYGLPQGRIVQGDRPG
ncbi:hypothetical protein [Actinomadura sp. 3N508]|uniref:hypothetical protein n=1 Tax=Actinomadura sp. 3N508 TaxID=3375153 RepID=UPI00379F94EA